MIAATMYDTIIHQESVANGMPFGVVKGVIKKESNFDPNCELGGAVGLMQMTLPAAREMGYKGSLKALYGPPTNIKYGTKYLKSMVGIWDTVAPTYDDRISLGLASYNLGQGRIKNAVSLAKKPEWAHVKSALNQLIGTAKSLTKRRINITLNYVDMIKTYAAEFNPLHDEMLAFADSGLKK